MAESKPIKNTELIQKDVFQNTIDQAIELETALTGLVTSFKAINKETTKQLKGVNIVDSKTLKEANTLLVEATKNRKLAKTAEEQLLKVQREKLLLEREQQKLNQEVLKTEALILQAEKKATAEQEKKNKATEKEIAQQKQINSAYKQASNQLNELRNIYKDLVISGKGAEQETKALLEQIKKLDAELKEVDASVGQFNREVGNYKNSMKDAINESDLFSKSLGGMSESNQIVVEGFHKLSKGLGELKKGINETEGTSKKLGLTLKGLGIGLLISALVSLGAFFKSSREGAQSFSLIFAEISATISVLVGNLSKAGSGFVALGTAFNQFLSLKFSDASKTATSAIKDITSAFDGTVERIKEVTKAQIELTKQTYEYENALRRLQLAQLKSNLDEEDYNEIASDTTRTLKEQKTALEQASKQRLISAQIGAEIAQKEQDIAFETAIVKLKSMQVSEDEIKAIRKRGAEALITADISKKLSDEELNALNEKVKANIEAQDKLSDLPRQEAQRRRDQIQKETEYEIELTRSKKLSASSQTAILTKQLADEKIQLEERQKLRLALNEQEKSIQKNQFELFNKGIEEENKINKKGDADQKQRVDFQDLINTKDEVALSEKIRRLKLSENQQTEVAKVVKEAQLQEITNNDLIAKQEEEEIKRKQTIASLEADILEIQKQTELDIIRDNADKKQKALDEANSKILNGENVYNRKLIQARKEAFIESQILIEKEFELRKQQLEDKATIAKIDIDNTENDDKIKAEKKKKIDEQLLADQTKLQLEQNNKVADANKKERDEEIAIDKKKTEILINEITKVSQALSDELDKRNQAQDEARQKDIDKQNTAVDRQRELAEKGANNTLAFEEAQLAKKEQANRDALEREARIKQQIADAEAYMNAYNARLQQADADPNTAPIQALSDVLLAKGIAKGFVGLSGFYEGTEHVASDLEGNKFSNGRDGYVVRVDGAERILTGDQNKKIGNISNEQLADIAFNYNNGLFDKKFIPSTNIQNQDGNYIAHSQNNIMSSILIQQNEEMTRILKEINDKPVQMVDVDKFGNLLEKVYKKGVTVVTTRKQRL